MAGMRAVGEVREVGLERGVIRYREVGDGPALVFVHGFLVNGDLWRRVVPELAERYRCVVPDLPLGSHAVPMLPDADLSPPGLARLVAGFLEALDLSEVTLVGNDTGGAICQLVVAGHAERVDGLVLTNCDAFENFPQALFRPLRYGARVPGFVSLLARVLRTPLARRALLATVAHNVPEEEVIGSYLGPIVCDAGVRRDVGKLLRGASKRYTVEAARSFSRFREPVLVVWGEDDFLFPMRFAERLRDAFPDARLERVARSRTFVPEDRPERLVQLVDAFLRTRIGAR
jgi:pimeloyl-ACP methyl ester carboxylesterase